MTRVPIYSLVLLSQFWTTQSFHVASWPIYRFLWRQVRWSGIPISLRIFHNVKGFSIVSEAEVDVFPLLSPWSSKFWQFDLWFVCFSKPSLYIWKFSVHTLLEPSLKDFEHYPACIWNEHSCTVVCTFLGIAPLWDINENWPFPVLWPLLSFPNLVTF